MDKTQSTEVLRILSCCMHKFIRSACGKSVCYDIFAMEEKIKGKAISKLDNFSFDRYNHAILNIQSAYSQEEA